MQLKAAEYQYERTNNDTEKLFAFPYNGDYPQQTDNIIYICILPKDGFVLAPSICAFLNNFFLTEAKSHCCEIIHGSLEVIMTSSTHCTDVLKWHFNYNHLVYWNLILSSKF